MKLLRLKRISKAALGLSFAVGLAATATFTAPAAAQALGNVPADGGASFVDAYLRTELAARNGFAADQNKMRAGDEMVYRKISDSQRKWDTQGFAPSYGSAEFYKLTRAYGGLASAKTPGSGRALLVKRLKVLLKEKANDPAATRMAQELLAALGDGSAAAIAASGAGAPGTDEKTAKGAVASAGSGPAAGASSGPAVGAASNANDKTAADLVALRSRELIAHLRESDASAANGLELMTIDFARDSRDATGSEVGTANATTSVAVSDGSGDSASSRAGSSVRSGIASAGRANVALGSSSGFLSGAQSGSESATPSFTREALGVTSTASVPVGTTSAPSFSKGFLDASQLASSDYAAAAKVALIDESKIHTGSGQAPGGTGANASNGDNATGPFLSAHEAPADAAPTDHAALPTSETPANFGASGENSGGSHTNDATRAVAAAPAPAKAPASTPNSVPSSVPSAKNSPSAAPKAASPVAAPTQVAAAAPAAPTAKYPAPASQTTNTYVDPSSGDSMHVKTGDTKNEQVAKALGLVKQEAPKAESAAEPLPQSSPAPRAGGSSLMMEDDNGRTVFVDPPSLRNRLAQEAQSTQVALAAKNASARPVAHAAKPVTPVFGSAQRPAPPTANVAQFACRSDSDQGDFARHFSVAGGNLDTKAMRAEFADNNKERAEAYGKVSPPSASDACTAESVFPPPDAIRPWRKDQLAFFSSYYGQSPWRDLCCMNPEACKASRARSAPMVAAGMFAAGMVAGNKACVSCLASQGSKSYAEGGEQGCMPAKSCASFEENFEKLSPTDLARVAALNTMIDQLPTPRVPVSGLSPHVDRPGNAGTLRTIASQLNQAVKTVRTYTTSLLGPYTGVHAKEPTCVELMLSGSDMFEEFRASQDSSKGDTYNNQLREYEVLLKSSNALKRCEDQGFYVTQPAQAANPVRWYPKDPQPLMSANSQLTTSSRAVEFARQHIDSFDVALGSYLVPANNKNLGQDFRNVLSKNLRGCDKENEWGAYVVRMEAQLRPLLQYCADKSGCGANGTGCEGQKLSQISDKVYPANQSVPPAVNALLTTASQLTPVDDCPRILKHYRFYAATIGESPKLYALYKKSPIQEERAPASHSAREMLRNFGRQRLTEY